VITGFRLGLAGLTGIFFCRLPRAQWLLIHLTGMTMFALPLILICMAVKSVNPTVVAMITNFEVIFAILIERLWFRTAVSWPEMAGILLAFVGANLVIISPEITDSNMTGLLLTGGAAFSYAVASFQVKRIRMPAFSVTVWTALAGSLQCFLFSLWDKSWQATTLADYSLSFWSLLVWSSLSTFVAFFLWNYLLQNNPVYRVSALVTLIPAASLLIGWVFLGAGVHWQAILGGVLCTLGMALHPLLRTFVRASAPEAGRESGN